MRIAKVVSWAQVRTASLVSNIQRFFGSLTRVDENDLRAELKMLREIGLSTRSTEVSA